MFQRLSQKYQSLKRKHYILALENTQDQIKSWEKATLLDCNPEVKKINLQNYIKKESKLLKKNRNKKCKLNY